MVTLLVVYVNRFYVVCGGGADKSGVYSPEATTMTGQLAPLVPPRDREERPLTKKKTRSMKNNQIPNIHQVARRVQ